ncbi:MAG: hypothetical protein JXR05_08765 [Flavobacteriaceae bacterium]
MGKKIIYALTMIFGVLLLLMFILSIPKTISELLSNQDIAFKIGYVFGSLVFVIPGFFLTRYGYRKLNPSAPKRKETIEDIGVKKR